MSPECLYWIALVVLVLPSLAFNRMAAVVLSVWAFGHFTHMTGPYEVAAYMFASIVALGAGVALSQPWDGSRRAYANGAVTGLFVPSSLLFAYAAIYFERDPANMQEYHAQLGVYWTTWAVIMTQAILVPFGNDWQKVRDYANKFDAWAIGKIVKHFGDAV